MKTISLMTGMLLAALGILLMLVSTIAAFVFLYTILSLLPVWMYVILFSAVSVGVLFYMFDKDKGDV